MSQVLSKTLDSTALTPEKVELATITKDPDSGAVSLAISHLPCTAEISNRAAFLSKSAHTMATDLEFDSLCLV